MPASSATTRWASAPKEALIKLLEDKRAAMISRVVTQGFDPDVAMKDSKIPRLGGVPAHWEIRRLKHISSKQTVGMDVLERVRV